MPWVKRNLGLVIGGAVALLLMGLAGFYLWTKISEDKEVTAQLDEQTAAFQAVLGRPVHPGDNKINNIELAREQKLIAARFLQQVRSQFGKRDVPTNISNREFRALLDRTIADLQNQAGSLGVTLPDRDYWFTFSPQKQAVEFQNPQMLTHQLLDVKEITGILYDAKVHDLTRLRRVPTSSHDNNPTDFLDKQASTNEFAIVTPYEVGFQAFTSELAKVLEGLVAAPHCFVVTSISVSPAPEDGGPAGQMTSPSGVPGVRGGAVPGQYPGQRFARPNNVLLDEGKLLFTLGINSVRLKPGTEPAVSTPPVAQN